jgi:MFS family permease
VVGSRRIFRGALALFGGAMVAMAASVDSMTLLVAQTVAGAAAAALTPASIELIQDHYAGEQRERALAWLSAIHSLSLAPAFLIAGATATWMSWRATFAVLVLMAAIVYILSERLHDRRGLFARSAITRPEGIGLALFAIAMLFIGLGSDRLSQWGLLLASPDAPFSVLNISPALLVIVCGIFLVKLVLVWSHRRCTDGPLVALRVIIAPRPRSTLLSMFSISAVSSGVTFLIPLYVEIVQGRSSWYTALVLIPLTIASFAATVLVTRFSGRLSQRTKTLWGFVVVFAGLALLGGVVRNDWSDLWVIVSLAMIGFGEGALTAMLFAGLASICPREIADDVEPVCDATSHLAAAVGAALAGAIVIGVLGAAVDRQLARDPATATQLRGYLDLNRVAFVSNDRLQQVLERTAATPEQVKNAIRINTDARLLALKLAFLVLAGVTLIGLVPIARDVSHRVTGTRPDSAR